MKLKTIYLLLAIVGAIVPYLFFSQFMLAEGIDLIGFIAALFVNDAAGGFSADLLISSFVFWLWMFSRQASGPKPWLFVVLNLAIGLSCALPAYLYAASDKDNGKSP